MAETTEKSPKDLIDRLVFDDSIRSDVNSFDLRQHLFDFGVDSDMSLNRHKPVPSLKEEFHHSHGPLSIDLGVGMAQALENRKMITNYDKYRKQIWIHFLRCLHKHKTIAEEEPTFVSLTGTIADLFGVEQWDSTFYGLKYKGVIYLFRNESIDLDDNNEVEVTAHVYFLIRFHYLISNKNDADINGLEKCLSVDRIDLNGNKLIVCNGMAANDMNGAPIYVKCRQIYKRFQDSEYRYKLLHDWANCMIDGAQTLVIGRRYKATLQEIKVMDVQTVPVMCRSYWSDSKCFSYVDQSLEFIKSCIGSELELYEFAINSTDYSISCFRCESTENSEYFLPKFYTQTDSDSIDSLLIE